jgi:hypothetical protein
MHIADTKSETCRICKANLFFHLFGQLVDQQIQIIVRRYKQKLRKVLSGNVPIPNY